MKKIIFFQLIIGLILGFLSLKSSTKETTKRIVQIKGDYICISLGNYLDEINRLIKIHEKIPEDIETMFGMSWLEGYVLDNEDKDIILVGKRINSKPVYHAEDLLINMQNIFDSARSPYCSLDPKPENIKRLNSYLNHGSDDFEKTISNCQQIIGDQQVVIGGVPRNSRHAKIMIYADYDMKKISQGLVHIPGIRSCIDLAISSNGKSLENGSSMSRFWFHIKENKEGRVYPNYIENEGIVFINECPVVILTEKQMIDADGNTSDDTSKEDAIADTFATDMSRNFNEATKANTLFAELENLFRLQACLKSVEFKGVLDMVNNNILQYKRMKFVNDDDHPLSLPGLINWEITEKKDKEAGEIRINKRLFLVCGGVSQEFLTDKNNFINDHFIGESRTVIVNSRPDSKSVHWIAKLL
jgi:hypothetical protein